MWFKGCEQEKHQPYMTLRKLSGFLGHQVCMWHTDIHVVKRTTHIKEINMSSKDVFLC